MALDTGRIVDFELEPATGGDPRLVDTYAPTLHSGANIGEALRMVREFRGLSLDDLAERTRVRRAYLAAIEELRLDQLPSRPFTIGYIRSYATALGLDPEEATYRFKADEPVLDEPLRAPVGVHDDRDPRLSALIAGGCVIVGAIFMWNIAQRAMIDAAPPPPLAPEAVVAEALKAQKDLTPILGAPLPAPVESTTPALYETPGLSKAGADGRGNLDPPAILGVTPADFVAPDTSQLPAVFKPEGKVYGAAPNQPSMVTLKALRSGALIIRGADGSVYFARQLSKGEAYRIPAVDGLTVDVSDPYAFQVFAAGQSRGFLPAALSSASKLGG
ncbi:helix-turn-helix domain-containing protein [Phenylobacterium sp.]|jgi:transcriptional regulator with XRE-family HTH domain|uniref:helix-turn-helix domain-containing protein n=1 Tax=Phenylobacterium sp. TaxID=1871053 RepID=UPI002F955303